MTKLMLSIVLQLQPFLNICLELHINDPRFVFITKCRASQMGFYLQEASFSHFGLLWWEITSKQVRFSCFTYLPPLSAPLLIHHMVSRERSGSAVMEWVFPKKHLSFYLFASCDIKSQMQEENEWLYFVSFYLRDNITSYSTMSNTFFGIILQFFSGQDVSRLPWEMLLVIFRTNMSCPLFFWLSSLFSGKIIKYLILSKYFYSRWPCY